MSTTLDMQSSIPVGAAAVTPLSSALAREETTELNDELLLGALLDHAAEPRVRRGGVTRQALYLSTFNHLLIVNKTSLPFSCLSLSRFRSFARPLALSRSLSLSFSLSPSPSLALALALSRALSNSLSRQGVVRTDLQSLRDCQ